MRFVKTSKYRFIASSVDSLLKSTTYKTAQNSNIDTKEFYAVLFLLFEINNL